MEKDLNINDLKILIVDDDKWIHKIISKHLSAWGFKISSAYDPYDGLQQAVEVQPFLMFVDIYLPDISGEFLLKMIKKLNQTTSIPVLIISANIDKSLIQRTIQWGATGLLAKPVTPNSLARKVQDCLPPLLFKELYEKYPDFKNALLEGED